MYYIIILCALLCSTVSGYNVTSADRVVWSSNSFGCVIHSPGLSPSFYVLSSAYNCTTAACWRMECVHSNCSGQIRDIELFSDGSRGNRSVMFTEFLSGMRFGLPSISPSMIHISVGERVVSVSQVHQILTGKSALPSVYCHPSFDSISTRLPLNANNSLLRTLRLPNETICEDCPCVHFSGEDNKCSLRLVCTEEVKSNNRENTMFSCCPDLVSEDTHAVASHSAPITATFSPDGLSFSVHFVSQYLIPMSWLVSDISHESTKKWGLSTAPPYANCQTIFSPATYSRLLPPNYRVTNTHPVCKWMDDTGNSDAVVLMVYLPNNALIRASEWLGFSFNVNLSTTETRGGAVSEAVLERELLSRWMDIKNRYDSIAAADHESIIYATNRSKLVDSTKVGNISWVISLSSSSRAPTRAPTEPPSIRPSTDPSLSPSYVPSETSPSLSPTHVLHNVSAYPFSEVNSSEHIDGNRTSNRPSGNYTAAVLNMSSTAQGAVNTTTLDITVNGYNSSTHNNGSFFFLLPYYSLSVNYSTVLLPPPSGWVEPTLLLLAPSEIYSPCLSWPCNQATPGNELVLDASASYGGGIVGLSFSWFVSSVSCTQVSTKCLYSTAVLDSNMAAIESYILRNFSDSDSILRIPSRLLLSNTLISLHISLSSEPSRTYESTYADVDVIITDHVSPTVTIDACYFHSNSSKMHRDPPNFVLNGQKAPIQRSILWDMNTLDPLQPIIDFPFNSLPLSHDVQFFWAVYDFVEINASMYEKNSAANSSSSDVEKSATYEVSLTTENRSVNGRLVFSSRSRLLSIPPGLLECGSVLECSPRNQSRYIVTLAVDMHSPRDVNRAGETPVVVAWLNVLPLRVAPRIIGGSRCVHSDTAVVLQNAPISGIDESRVSYEWSCWVVDTRNAEIMEGTQSGPINFQTQCSTGNEFSSISNEITSADISRTASCTPSLRIGCGGHNITTRRRKRVQSTSDFLILEPYSLAEGVQYKICLGLRLGSSSSNHHCVGVYVYIPDFSDSIELHSNASLREKSIFLGPAGPPSMNVDSRLKSFAPFLIHAPFIFDIRRGRRPTGGHAAEINSEHPVRVLALMQSVNTSSPGMYRLPVCSTMSTTNIPSTQWGISQILPKVHALHKNAPANAVVYLQSTHSGQLSIARNSFSGGLSFVLSVAGKCHSNDMHGFVERGYAEINVVVRTEPWDGSLNVFPSTGTAFETMFSVRQSDWLVSSYDSDLPLQFSFHYSSSHILNKINPDAVLENFTAYYHHASNERGELIMHPNSICFRDWMRTPHATLRAPHLRPSAVDISNPYNGYDNLWNASLFSNSCSIIVVSGYVRTYAGGIAVRHADISVCPPPIVSTSVNAITEAKVYSKNLSTMAALKVVHDYTDTISTTVLSNYIRSQDTLQSVSMLHSLASFMNTYLPKSPWGVFKSSCRRREMRTTMIAQLEVVASWQLTRSSVTIEKTNLEFNTVDFTYMRLVPFVFSQACIELGLFPHDMNEVGKKRLLRLVYAIVKMRLADAQPTTTSLGYSREENCVSLFYSRYASSVSYLLATLDHSAPLIVKTYNDSTKSPMREMRSNGYDIKGYIHELPGANLSHDTLYKQSLLGLRQILVGCSLLGDTVGSGVDQTLYSLPLPQPQLRTNAPTLSPTSHTSGPFDNVTLNRPDDSLRYNQNITGNFSNSSFFVNFTLNELVNSTADDFSLSPTPSQTPSVYTSLQSQEFVEFLYEGGSQIAALRQPAFIDISQASVVVGENQNSGGPDDIEYDRPPGFSAESSIDPSTHSFLQLPCESSNSADCYSSSSLITRSRKSLHALSLHEVFELTASSEGYIDISLFNIAQRDVSGQELSASDTFTSRSTSSSWGERNEEYLGRSWIPHSGDDRGVSDAVIVEFKTYGDDVEPLYNLSRPVEVGVKVSRPDVLWKLVVIEDEDLFDGVSKQYRPPYLRSSGASVVNITRDNEYLEGYLSFSPRWVRCEMFDSDSMTWVKPSWLDGWWSPDVVSFTSRKELESAAEQHMMSFGSMNSGRRLDENVRQNGESVYLALNSSVDMLPTSLSCFVNSLPVSSYQPWDNGTAFWLQWRVVVQSSDPCGGCSDHGVCVLFRTAPVCLCQNNYRGRFCDEYVSTNKTSSDTEKWLLSRSISSGGLRGIGLLSAILLVCCIICGVGNKLFYAHQQAILFNPQYDFVSQDDSAFTYQGENVQPGRDMYSAGCDGCMCEVCQCTHSQSGRHVDSKEEGSEGSMRSVSFPSGTGGRSLLLDSLKYAFHGRVMYDIASDDCGDITSLGEYTNDNASHMYDEWTLGVPVQNIESREFFNSPFSNEQQHNDADLNYSDACAQDIEDYEPRERRENIPGLRYRSKIYERCS